MRARRNPFDVLLVGARGKVGRSGAPSVIRCTAAFSDAGAQPCRYREGYRPSVAQVGAVGFSDAADEITVGDTR